MELIQEKLLLQREVDRLQLNQKQLTAKVSKLESEQLELLDLKVKLEKEVTAANEKKSKILNEISDEKGAWGQQKYQEEQLLNEDKIETKKILNRESYVESQELKLKEEKERLTVLSQDVAERQRILDEGMGFLERDKKQREMDILTHQKTVDDLKQQLVDLKTEFIKKVELL